MKGLRSTYGQVVMLLYRFGNPDFTAAHAQFTAKCITFFGENNNLTTSDESKQVVRLYSDKLAALHTNFL